MAVKYIIKEKKYLDTFFGKIFNHYAKGIESKAVKDLKKKDPEFKKAHEKGEEAVKKMHDIFREKGLKIY